MADEKNITLKNHTIKRMLRVADSFDETPDSVINRLLDFYEQRQERPLTSTAAETARPPFWSPFDPPSLRHTKVMAATLDGREITPPSWNRLVDEAVRHARKKLGSFSALKKVTTANLIEGVKQDQGYRYLSDVHLSVQGQDAQDAWRCVAQLARSQGFGIEVHFLWRDNPDAAYPGQVGNLIIGGKT